MELLDLILKYKTIILFYGIIILLIYIFRKKLTFQGKFVALYKAKWGIKWMDIASGKHRELIKILGYCGIGLCYVGGAFLIGTLIWTFFKVITVPGTSSGIALVLPGVNVPGIGVLPFTYWIISIFVILIVHEFSHGIVARAWNIKVNYTGIGMFAFFPVAFVEPDEKQIKKEKDIVQYSIFAAGPFSNVLLAISLLLLLIFVIVPIHSSLIEPETYTITGVINDSPAYNSGLRIGTEIIEMDGFDIEEFEKYRLYFNPSPNETMTMKSINGTEYIMTSEQIEDNPYNGKYGFNYQINYELKEKIKENYFYNISYYVLDWIKGLFMWLYLLSLAIGLFNMLPIGPLDGGQIARLNFEKIKGKEKGNVIWKKISIFIVLFILFLMLLPTILNFFM